MKKKLTILALMVMVLSQIISPIQIVIAETLSDTLTIKELKVDSEIEALFDIGIPQSKNSDELVMLLPNSVKYDSVKTKEMNDEKAHAIYDVETHSVTVTGAKSHFLLALKDVESGQHTLTVTLQVDSEKVDSSTISFSRDILQTKESQQVAPYTEADNDYLKPNNETAPDLQRDLKIQRVGEEFVESGNDALFKLTLKTTGSQVKYNQSEIIVQLPELDVVSFTQDLNELGIAGVVPTYDSDKKKLTYTFDELKSGQTYERIIKLHTANGMSANGTSVIVKSELKLGNGDVDISQTDSAVKKIKSSHSMAIQKAVLTTKKIPTLGSTVSWVIKVSVPKNKTGQMYLKPGTKISVHDELPEGLTFTKSQSGTPSPTISGKKLTWMFDAPSLEEQIKSTDSLFTKTLYIDTKVGTNNKYVGELENKATIAGTSIDGKTQSPADSTTANVIIAESEPSTGQIEGSVVMPQHLGPADGMGKTVGTNQNKDPNPKVYDDAYLLFEHGIRGQIYSYYHSMNNWTISYKIDEKLILDKIKTPGGPVMGKDWFMGRTNAEARENKPLITVPEYDLVLISEDTKGKENRLTIKSPEQGVFLTRKDFIAQGFVDSNRIKEVQYVFKNAPQAVGAPRVKYYFKIKKGAVGEVENVFNMTGTSTWTRQRGPGGGLSTAEKFFTPNTQRPFDSSEDFADQYIGKNTIAGPRHATIVKRPTNQPPIAKINVSLLDQSGGSVVSGKNRMEIAFRNEDASILTIQKKLESSVLLPPGVKLATKPNATFIDGGDEKTSGSYRVISDNFNGSGRQLVGVVWDEDRIKIGETIKAELDVDISDKAPNQLFFDVYGFSGDDALKVPSSESNSITDTILQTKNTDDLNGDGKNDNIRIKSGNNYTLNGIHDLQAEKFVRQTDDDEWSNLAKVTPGENFEYKLFMTNTTGKDLSSMTLIDVLPSVGDIGITDNVARGSKFTPSLKGPIHLPAEWQGKVKVFYSKAKNPKRDDLTRNVDYPNGVTKLTNPTGVEEPNWVSESKVIDWSSIHSFKVELLPGETWIKGVDMAIIYTMAAPKVDEIKDQSLLNPLEDISKRTAYNSFAIATDRGLAVEPFQVGVYMDVSGSLLLTKVDKEKDESGKVRALAGAEFELYDKDNHLVTKLVTDEHGQAKTSSLALGSYTLKETKAPKGYNLLTKPIKVEITSKELDVSLTVENSKTGWHLPTTGGIGTILFYGVGIGLMSIGTVLALRKKNHQTK